MHTSEFAAVAANRMSLQGNTVLRLADKGEMHWTHYVSRFCTAGIYSLKMHSGIHITNVPNRVQVLH